MDSEEIETYSPDIKESVPVPVDADTTGFEEVMEKDGLINTKLNERVIIQRIAKDLYKNATSGLRELYNNSVRACRVAVKKYGEEKPLIRITMNEKTRKLTITDNGIGVSKERFKKVLLELGTSDNLDAGEVGQFGMGFASYMTLSSVVMIDTRARNGDQYRMMAKDGMTFQPVGDAQLRGYGTQLEMTCYENVNFGTLCNKLERIVKYSGVPTILELNNFDYYPDSFTRGANSILQCTFDEDVKSYTTAKTDRIEIKTEEFHLIALVSGRYVTNNNDHVHLLNVPIESNIEMPFSWWILNIKDERRFKPMPDRDRMTEEADNKLEGLLDKVVKKYFSDLDIQTYQQFLESKRKNEFLWLCNNVDYAPTQMREVLTDVNRCTVRKVVYNTKSFDDSSLVWQLVDNYHVIYQGYKNRGVTEKVKEFEPNSLLITTKKTKKTHWKQHVAFMAKFGIPSAKQILIDHKVKMPKNSKLDLEVIGHTHSDYYQHEIVDLDDIDENVIRVDNMPMADMIRYVKAFINPYTFVRNATELDEYDSRDYSEWLKEIPNIMCATNHGAKSIKELAEIEEVVIFCTDFEVEFEYFFKEEKRIIVYGSDQLMPMVLYLNQECQVDEKVHPINQVLYQEFTTFVEEKYNVGLRSDTDKKFFCTNMMKVDPCFHALLGNLLKNTGWTMEDDKKIMMWKDFVKMIQKFEPFDYEDKLAQLRFYYGERLKIADSSSLLGETLDSLANSVRDKIDDNEYLKARLLKEMILPKVFGHIEFRSMKKEQLSYEDAYEISIATHDTEFSFRDNMEVYGFNLQFRGCKMKINKGYCSIKMVVYITT